MFSAWATIPRVEMDFFFFVQPFKFFSNSPMLPTRILFHTFVNALFRTSSSSSGVCCCVSLCTVTRSFLHLVHLTSVNTSSLTSTPCSPTALMTQPTNHLVFTSLLTPRSKVLIAALFAVGFVRVSKQVNRHEVVFLL